MHRKPNRPVLFGPRGGGGVSTTSREFNSMGLPRLTKQEREGVVVRTRRSWDEALNPNPNPNPNTNPDPNPNTLSIVASLILTITLQARKEAGVYRQVTTPSPEKRSQI